MLKRIIKKWLVMVLLAPIFFLNNCNLNSDDPPVVENPAPVLSGISPSEKVAHLPAFTLTVTGSGFVSASVILFNGQEKPTQFVSSTELSCSVTPEEIAGNGASPAGSSRSNGTASSSGATVVPVTVRTPSPGGGDSDPLSFTIYNDFNFTVSQALPLGVLPIADPQLAVDSGGNLSIMYRSNTGGFSEESIDFIRSTDGGLNWSPPVTVVGADPERYLGFYAPFHAVDGDGNIHAMLNENRGGVEVTYCYSTDNGSSWSSPSVIAADVNGNYIERLMMPDPFGGINFIIMKYDVEGHQPVWYKRYTDFGATLEVFTDLWNGWEDSYSFTANPVMVFDNDQGVYVSFNGEMYTDGSYNKVIYFNYSHDSGTAWNTTDTVVGPGAWSALAVTPGGNIHLFALPYTMPLSQNYITHYHSSDRGVTWNEGSTLTVPGSGESYLHAAADGAGNINLLYHRGTGYYFRRSIDNGVTWLDEIEVMPNATGFSRGKLKTDASGNLYFIMYADPDGNGGYGPVYLIKGR